MPKKRRLGPQNGSGSSGPEKLLKIVSYAETEKLKETMVGAQVEFADGHQYPPGSVCVEMISIHPLFIQFIGLRINMSNGQGRLDM